MKPSGAPFVIKMVFAVTFVFLLFTSNALASNIQGYIYDKQRNALADIDVELLNDYYQTIQRTRTDGVGKYNFENLTDGRYTVRALAFRYDLIDQEIPVEIYTQGIKTTPGVGSTVSTGTGTFIQDFYLLPKKGSLRDSELGVVFVQEISKEAKAAYEQAIADFSKKRDEEGFNNLKKALELVPNYYAALHRYGMELYARKQYLEAAGAFMEAVKVNEKSATSFYFIGLSFQKLGKTYYKAALRSLNVAYTLAPNSMQVLWLLGKIEREMSLFPEAEKHLLAAKKLANNKVPEIHKELSQLYANDLKKYNEAADELELYLKSSKAGDAEEKEIKEMISKLRTKAKAGS